MATPIPPALGAVKPGELYVDLQSRTLWLGVDPAVDTAGAVLISDIVNLQAEDAAIRADTATYVNAAVAPLAPKASPVFSGVPTAPTPPPADNDFSLATTAFVMAAIAALGQASFTRGMIMMWSGLLTEIGVGPLAGWALCDGNLGTPNLKDKFIIGAGNKLVGTVPAAGDLIIGGGAHIHTINPFTLLLEHLPSHNHGGATLAGSAHAHGPGTLSAASAGAHSHTVAAYKATSEQGTISVGDKILKASDPTVLAAQVTSTDGAHTHGLEGATAAESAHTHPIPSTGGGQGHAHTMVGGGGIHNHNVTPAVLREAIPYFALAYIMKL